MSDMANNCSLLEITIEHEHDTANGAYNPLTIKNDLLNRIDHSGCGATEIISELVSSIPYTRIAVSKQNKKKTKHEKMVQRIQNNIAQDINEKVVRELHSYYASKITALESTVSVLENGVETKAELKRIKSGFKEKTASLQEEIDDLKLGLSDCRATVENKEKVITMLTQLSASDTSSIFGGNGTTKEKKHTKIHPTLAKITTSLDENGNLVVNCPDLWIFRNAFFFAGVVGTTIGYGDIYPVTTGGKVFCMFYALTSVPFFNFLLGKICESVHVFLLSRDARGEITEAKKIKLVGTYVLFGLVGTIAIPACAFMLLEDRKFIDAIYFVVISLTTVGFGDITPSFKDELLFDLYRVAVLIWIFFGLAYIGGLAPLVNELFNKKVLFGSLLTGLKDKVGKKKQRKRVKDLVDVLHSDLLSDFEDELRNYRRNKDYRRKLVHETIQYTTINIKGNLYITSPNTIRAAGPFEHQLRFIDDFNSFNGSVDSSSTSSESDRKIKRSNLFNDL